MPISMYSGYSTSNYAPPSPRTQMLDEMERGAKRHWRADCNKIRYAHAHHYMKRCAEIDDSDAADKRSLKKAQLKQTRRQCKQDLLAHRAKTSQRYNEVFEAEPKHAALSKHSSRKRHWEMYGMLKTPKPYHHWRFKHIYENHRPSGWNASLSDESLPWAEVDQLERPLTAFMYRRMKPLPIVLHLGDREEVVDNGASQGGDETVED
ncbi:uncharacterized protein BCR38DRAFT_491409 [Pseudomassariella vexata]|uniref:Uncharacterized protein n=1 Tax=Pseudomassariella vexata TaxID=1141098 RepID=A0A1Y2D617_9PEZI|nr:uncharacterized protein BCR38DRAFT_491409 [Pseudomassariella vexata]ORY54721.1 hypothetical protein BCR38DRAFT_491409 [Pseudomassariella vexata]